MHQRIGNAYADDRADQGVRARSRETEIPGAEIPYDRGDQQREHHRKPGGAANLAPCRALSPHARAKKLARAAECLVYSLTPSGVLAENHPKNRGFVGILRGQKCPKRRFSRRSPVGEWSRGALDASGFWQG